ncbi:MAG: exodeoxyribonuclease VII small subunit [Verrucomicrobiales bacterium]
MSRSKEQSRGEADNLPFEKAITRVEEIVAAMESDQLPLENLIQFYEEGTRLLQVCRLRLEEAQKKVEIITRKASGGVELRPVEADEIPDAQSGAVRSTPRAVTPSEVDDEIPF